MPELYSMLTPWQYGGLMHHETFMFADELENMSPAGNCPAWSMRHGPEWRPRTCCLHEHRLLPREHCPSLREDVPLKSRVYRISGMPTDHYARPARPSTRTVTEVSKQGRDQVFALHDWMRTATGEFYSDSIDESPGLLTLVWYRRAQFPSELAQPREQLGHALLPDNVAKPNRLVQLERTGGLYESIWTRRTSQLTREMQFRRRQLFLRQVVHATAMLSEEAIAQVLSWLNQAVYDRATGYLMLPESTVTQSVAADGMTGSQFQNNRLSWCRFMWPHMND